MTTKREKKAPNGSSKRKTAPVFSRRKTVFFTAVLALLFIGATVAFFILGDTSEIIKTASKIPPLAMFALAGLSIASVVLRTFRWNTILGSFGRRISFFPSLKATFAGLAAGLVTPAKAGEFSRCAIYKKAHKIPLSQSIFSLIFERLFDFAIILSFATAFFISRSDKFPLPAVAVSIALGIVVVSLLFFSVFPKFAKSILPPKAKGFLLALAERKGHVKGCIARVVFLSIAIWLTEFARIVLIFALLGISSDVPFIIQAYCVSVVAGIISAIPGGFGASELSTAALYATKGVPAAQSITAVFVDRLTGFWPVVLGGLVFLPSAISAKSKE